MVLITSVLFSCIHTFAWFQKEFLKSSKVKKPVSDPVYVSNNVAMPEESAAVSTGEHMAEPPQAKAGMLHAFFFAICLVLFVVGWEGWIVQFK